MRFLVLFPVLLAIAASDEGCNKVSDSQPVETPAEATWIQMSIDPIQCHENPWEIAWLSENPDDYKSLQSKEGEIVLEYLKTNGVEARNFSVVKTMEMVCEACTCPRGDTMYLEVKETDKAKMEQLGFGPPREAMPSDE